MYMYMQELWLEIVIEIYWLSLKWASEVKRKYNTRWLFVTFMPIS